MIWIVSVMLLFVTSSIARAEEIPRFDIETMCRNAPRLLGGNSDPYSSCMRDETDARQQLEQQWTSFDARRRATCVQETRVGGSPSYVDVLTCLQMAGGVPSTAPARRTQPNP